MIRLITDSSADLSDEIINKYGIIVVPLTIIFGEEEFKDGVNLSKREFYDKMESSAILPKTSQVNQYEFEEIYAAYPNDTIISIHLSGELSGTYRSAVFAKTAMERENIFVFDSRNVTFSLGAIVTETAKLIACGISEDAILPQVESLIEKVKILAVVGNLKYLKAGGRLTPTAAVIGNLLHIKPIISLVDGKVMGVNKEIGMKKAYASIVKIAKERDMSMPVYTGHSDCETELDAFILEYGAAMQLNECTKSFIGCTVGTHAGPGARGIAYFTK